jgi:hypothetical protein
MAKEFIIENKPLEFAELYYSMPNSNAGFKVENWLPHILKQYSREIDFEQLRRQMGEEVSFKLIIK